MWIFLSAARSIIAITSEFAAGLLADYGDARAIEPLQQALTRLPVQRDPGFLRNQGLSLFISHPVPGTGHVEFPLLTRSFSFTGTNGEP